MKINLAVYTAREGYSWQPGTSLSVDQLRAFKSCIGKFPATDAADLPFGGVFLKNDHVVFYRYHVAKKIDFRGRDALYCVLGVVPGDKAAEVDPKALFALPQFSAPMQPFPTEAELPPSDLSRVPDWLKNLEDHSLDVRISGPLDDLRYKVTQTLTKKPETLPTPEPVESLGVSSPTVPLTSAKQMVKPEQRPVCPDAHKPESSTCKSFRAFLCSKNSLAVLCGLVAVLVFALVCLSVSKMSGCVPEGEEKPPVEERRGTTTSHVCSTNASSCHACSTNASCKVANEILLRKVNERNEK